MPPIEMSHSGPFMREVMGGPDDDEAMMVLHHIVRSIDRYILRIPKRAGKGEAQLLENGE